MERLSLYSYRQEFGYFSKLTTSTTKSTNSSLFQAFDEHGMKVYQYYLTHRSSINPYPEWYGVPHHDDIQVNGYRPKVNLLR